MSDAHQRRVLSSREPSIPQPGGIPAGAQSTPCRAPAIRPGTIGHNALRGPGYVVLDMSIGKDVSLPGTRADLSVRADILNALNRTNYGGIRTNLSVANFGQVFSTAGTPRKVTVPGAPDLLDGGQHGPALTSDCTRSGEVDSLVGAVLSPSASSTPPCSSHRAKRSHFVNLPDPATFQWRDLRIELKNKMTGVYTVTSGGDFLWRNPIAKRMSPELRDVMRNADTTVGNLEGADHRSAELRQPMHAWPAAGCRRKRLRRTPTSGSTSSRLASSTAVWSATCPPSSTWRRSGSK